MRDQVQIEVKGTENLIKKIGQKVLQFLGSKPKPKVLVGYTAAYAIFVHENLEANHPNGGQAKYLEQPAREYRAWMAEMIKIEMSKGRTMNEGMVAAGLFLQAESQKLVPVDTGLLKSSAFTRVEN